MYNFSHIIANFGKVISIVYIPFIPVARVIESNLKSCISIPKVLHFSALDIIQLFEYDHPSQFYAE